MIYRVEITASLRRAPPFHYRTFSSTLPVCPMSILRFVQLDDFRKHEAELRRRGTEGDEGAYPCQLCGEELVNIDEIRRHLRSQMHCQRVDKLRRHFHQMDNC